MYEEFFMKTETSLILCQAQVGLFPKKRFLGLPKMLWSSCAQEGGAAKKAPLAFGARQLHLVPAFALALAFVFGTLHFYLVPGNYDCTCTL